MKKRCQIIGCDSDAIKLMEIRNVFGDNRTDSTYLCEWHYEEIDNKISDLGDLKKYLMSSKRSI
jgi:hypothetical protein